MIKYHLNFIHCWWECTSVQSLWKAVWRYLKQLKNWSAFCPSDPTPGSIFQGTRTTNSKEHKHPYVHCSIIYSCQVMEAAPVPTSRWVAKTTMGHLQYGILLGCKKEENFTLCDSMDGPGEHYAKSNKPVRETQILHDFSYMWNLMNKLN